MGSGPSGCTRLCAPRREGALRGTRRRRSTFPLCNVQAIWMKGGSAMLVVYGQSVRAIRVAHVSARLQGAFRGSFVSRYIMPQRQGGRGPGTPPALCSRGDWRAMDDPYGRGPLRPWGQRQFYLAAHYALSTMASHASGPPVYHHRLGRVTPCIPVAVACALNNRVIVSGALARQPLLRPQGDTMPGLAFLSERRSCRRPHV